MSTSLVITSPDGITRRVDGYRFKSPDPQATKFVSVLDEPPAAVDLRKHMGPVEDHGESSSCVANAAGTAYEYLLGRQRNEKASGVSRSFISFNARSGSSAARDITIFDALRTLVDKGACSEKAWPYDVAHLHDEPPAAAYEEAAKFRARAIDAVPVELDTWKKALAEGYPIVFGLLVYESFDRQRQPGLIPVPTDKDLEGEQGEHAMLCVGYSQADEVFIVRNSWGPAWGDEGYCYIPFAYLMDTELNRGDAWILRGAEPIAADRATHRDRGVLDELDTTLGRMDDKSWTALSDALGDVALETRLALIFLAGAEADADVGESALGTIASALDEAFQRLGSPYEADRVLREALSLIDESALIDDSIVLIGEHFDEDALADIVRKAGQAAGQSDLSGAEEGTLADLVDAWLGGAAPREGGLVDGLPGEYDDVDYAGGVYGDDEEPEDLGDGFNEVED